MSMTKTDYELISSQIALYAKNDSNTKTPKSNRTAKNIAWDFANLLEQVNPKFKRERFLKDCGVLDD